MDLMRLHLRHPFFRDSPEPHLRYSLFPTGKPESVIPSAGEKPLSCKLHLALCILLCKKGIGELLGFFKMLFKNILTQHLDADRCMSYIRVIIYDSAAERR